MSKLSEGASSIHSLAKIISSPVKHYQTLVDSRNLPFLPFHRNLKVLFC